MNAMTCNGTKRPRCESTVSEASGLSTQTQLTDLSGSSPDENNVFNVRCNSANSDTYSTAKSDSAVPEPPSHFKFDARSRQRMVASRRASGQKVSFSLDENDLDIDGPCEQFGNGGKLYNYQPTRPISRPRHFSEKSDKTDNYTGHNQPLHHGVSIPYTQHTIDCECASCYDRKQHIIRELLHNKEAELTYRKSPSMHSLPELHTNGIPHQYHVSNYRRMSKPQFDTVVNVNEKGDGTYLHTVYKNPGQNKPSSRHFLNLETIQGGDTPSSTLEYRPLPQRPDVDQSVNSSSDASYAFVQGKNSEPLMDSPVSSKQSSESSRSEACFSCNKVTVWVILNIALILVIVSSVPVYFSVINGSQLHMNKTCVRCSVLDKFDNHEQLGMEKLTDDLCCLKEDTNLVDFIIKMRVVPTTTIKAEDEKIYYGRPVLQFKSMSLDDRKVHWNPRGLARSGLALKDNHKIEFKTSGYYFVSTEFAFKPNNQGIIKAEFTAFGNPNNVHSKDKPLRSQSETLTNQPNGSRYVSKCNFVDFFTAGSHLYVELDHVEGLQEEDGQILIFFLGN